MKIRSYFLVVLAVGMISMMSKPKKKRIVFFGDSITQAGVGPKGYITVMGELMQGKGKAEEFELIGAGISGNKITDLYMRLEDDVLAKTPNIVVIWIGVNDVWHKKGGTGTDAGSFERFYNSIIKKLQAKNIQVIMCTPAAVGERNDFSNELDGDLNRYSNIIRAMATKSNCELVDLRKRFHEYSVANNPENKDRGILTSDGVHLNDAGNMFVALEILKVLLK